MLGLPIYFDNYIHGYIIQYTDGQNNNGRIYYLLIMIIIMYHVHCTSYIHKFQKLCSLSLIFGEKSIGISQKP